MILQSQIMLEVLHNTAYGRNIDYIKGTAIQFYERAGSIQKMLPYTPTKVLEKSVKNI